MPVEEPGEIGRLQVLPLPVHHGQVEDHRLNLGQIGPDCLAAPVRQALVQGLIEGPQVVYPPQPAPQKPDVVVVRGLALGDAVELAVDQFLKLPAALGAPGVAAPHDQSVDQIEYDHAQADEPVSV